MDEDPIDIRPRRGVWLAVFAVATVAFVIGGIFYYRTEAARIRREEYQELATIGALKCGQIEHWLTEKLSSTARIAQDPLLSDAVAQLLTAPTSGTGSETAPSSDRLQATLRSRLTLELLEDVEDILLTNPEGKVLVAAGESSAPAGPVTRRTIEEALGGDKAVLSDLYRSADGLVYLDAVAPVHDAAGRTIAVIILRNRAASFLYPFLQSWPTPSRSAETLLVERDGEEVLFLNDLRHQAGTALSLRLPLSQVDLPARQAVLGTVGGYEGRDYQGVRVLADLRAVPGTRWYMITKMNTDELLAEARYRGIVATLFVAVTTFSAGAGIAYLSRRRQEHLYRGLYRSERRQREAQEELEGFFDIALDLLCIADLEGNFVKVNKAWEELLGCPVAELEQRSYLEFVHPDDVTPTLHAMAMLREEGAIYNFTNRYMLDDGTHRHLEWRASARGNLAFAAARDVTENMRAAARIHRNEERLRAIVRILQYQAETTQSFLDHALDEALALTGSKYGYIYHYDEGRRELKINSWSYAVMDACAVVDPQTCYELDKTGIWGEVVRQRRTILVNDFQADHPLKRGYPEGHVELDRFLTVPIFSDDEIAAVVGVANKDADYDETDVLQLQLLMDAVWKVVQQRVAQEERAASEARVREQALRVQAILDTVPEGVLVVDADGYVSTANPVADRDLDLLAGVGVGEQITRLGDAPLSTLLSSPTSGPWHEVKAEGRIFQVIARPMAEGPEPERYVMVIDDVTREREIRARMAQQERLAAVGQLAAGIAHDFNNILAVIVLYAQMDLQAEDLPPRIRGHIETIVQQSRQASDLIQQVLDFGRRAVIEPRPLDLAPFLQEQVKLLRRALPEDITIELTTGNQSLVVSADPTRMQQLITNLAVNARDAMPDGGDLHIGVARVQFERARSAPLPDMAPGAWVKIVLTDTGTGIAPDVLPHIFEPFYTTKEPGRGRGLGLAQVWGIVRQHGGHIDVQTRLEAGTTFTLYLPALEAPAGISLDGPVAPSSQGHGELILVVEDNPTLRAALVQTLEALAYRTLAASDGQEALALLQRQMASKVTSARTSELGVSQDIALILSDMVMPQMGGQALFHTLRRQNLRLPMVMMTGHPMERELQGLQAQGLAGWVLKPVRVDELADVLANALRDGA